MRICVIGPTYPFRGGIAHHTTLLVEALRSAGEEVLFISFKRQYPRLLYGRSDRDPSQNILKVETEYLLDSINPLTWIATLRRITRWKPDLVLLPWWVPFWAPHWLFLTTLLRRAQPRPVLGFICHNVYPHESGRFDRLAARLALRHGDFFVVHAAREREKLAHLFPERPIAVTPLPTYAALSAKPAAALPITLPSEEPILLFCGIVRSYKGLDVLLDALPLVEWPGLHLVIAGEFWEPEEIYREQIVRLGLSERVIVHNAYLSNEALAALLERATAVVLPYKSATQSAVIQLALGARRPVITTRVGGLPEAISEGKTGFIVPPEDPAALATAIETLLSQTQRGSFPTWPDEEPFGWDSLVEVIQQLAKQLR